MIFSDDARLAAQASCLFAAPGRYLPVVDGPRIQRPDRDGEVTRRVNVGAHARSRRFILVGLEDTVAQALEARLPPAQTIRANRGDDLASLAAQAPRRGEPLQWGRDRIGIGLLTALRAGRTIGRRD
jgi:hypothetical protein